MLYFFISFFKFNYFLSTWEQNSINDHCNSSFVANSYSILSCFVAFKRKKTFTRNFTRQNKMSFEFISVNPLMHNVYKVATLPGKKRNAVLLLKYLHECDHFEVRFHVFRGLRLSVAIKLFYYQNIFNSSQKLFRQCHILLKQLANQLLEVQFWWQCLDNQIENLKRPNEIQGIHGNMCISNPHIVRPTQPINYIKKLYGGVYFWL